MIGSTKQASTRHRNSAFLFPFFPSLAPIGKPCTQRTCSELSVETISDASRRNITRVTRFQSHQYSCMCALIGYSGAFKISILSSVTCYSQFDTECNASFLSQVLILHKIILDIVKQTLSSQFEFCMNRETEWEIPFLFKKMYHLIAHITVRKYKINDCTQIKHFINYSVFEWNFSIFEWNFIFAKNWLAIF